MNVWHPFSSGFFVCGQFGFISVGFRRAAWAFFIGTGGEGLLWTRIPVSAPSAVDTQRRGKGRDHIHLLMLTEMKYSTVCAPSSDDLTTTKKCKNDTETQLLTHQGGTVRLHLPLPLISHTKQVPEIVTVDIRQTIFRIVSRCFILTPKAILPAAFCRLCFRPAGGGLLQYGCYNSEVRRKQLLAIMGGSWSSSFPAIVFTRGVTLFSIPLTLFSYILPGGTSMLGSFCFQFTSFSCTSFLKIASP